MDIAYELWTLFCMKCTSKSLSKQLPYYNTKEVNFVQYQLVLLEYTVPISKPVHILPLFYIEKNIDRTGRVLAIPVKFSCFDR